MTISEDTQERIAAHVKAARWARTFARMHRRPLTLAMQRYAEAEKRLAHEAYERGIGYLRDAKRIKREAMR